MTQPTLVERTRQLVESMLDRGYVRATQQTIEAITRNSAEGVLAVRLRQFQQEAARLAEADERMAADNPVFRALMADFEGALRRNAALIDAAGPGVQRAGMDAAQVLTRELALPGMDDRMLAQIGVRWNTPDPDAVAALIDVVNRETWADELAKYQENIAGVVNQIAIRGIVDGWNPLRIARAVTDAVDGLPRSQANTLMRTLQLSSYRKATALHQMANSDILTGQIRIATLDNRTCLSCIALHGEELAVGQEVRDHHNGRCTSISIVRGRPRAVQRGEDWLRAQPEERQRAIMGHANFEAWQAGAVQMQDFVHEYRDPVFGLMVREASLRGILGDAARAYYR